HKDGLRWIAATTANSHTCILEKLTNLPDVNTRATHSHARLYHQLLTTPQPDPIHLVWHSSRFLQHLHSHLYEDLLAEERHPLTTLRLSHLLHQPFIYQHSHHVLCSYSRLGSSKTDSLFKVPDRNTQLMALRWRRNAFRPTDFICPIDGGYLSRSHVNHS